MSHKVKPSPWGDSYRGRTFLRVKLETRFWVRTHGVVYQDRGYDRRSVLGPRLTRATTGAALLLLKSFLNDGAP